MKLASIETVLEVKNHPNADRLDVVKVLGWEVVTKRGQFKPGDAAVLIVIDTVLPFAPWSEFLRDPHRPDRRIRLKTAKLRGTFSQGLLLPMDVLPEHVRGWQSGADVGGELGVTKYEKELPLALSGVARSTFPTHLAQKTDEDNGLSNLDIVDFVLSRPVYITQKLDGSSCTVIVRYGKPDHVCSRNLSLKDVGANAFWHAVKKLNFIMLADCVLQGELMGPGIQGNQLGLTEPTLYLFNKIQSHDTGPGAVEPYETLCHKACQIGCAVVPMVNATVKTLTDCQELADAQTLPDGKPAEGIVIRINPPQLFGNGRVAGFKIINRNYKDT